MVRKPQHAGGGALLSLALFVIIEAVSLPLGPCAQAAAEEAPALRGIALEVKDGKVSGDFAEQPLNAVLTALIDDPAVVPRIPTSLRGYPMSARFDSLPIKEAIEHILAPFNHVLVFSPDGESPVIIVVMGLRDKGDPVSQAGDIAAHQGVDIGAKPDGASAKTLADQAQPEAEIITSVEELLENPSAIEGISDEELLELALDLDIEVIAEEAGIPVEKLYLGETADGEEPQIDLNALRSLLGLRGL